MLCFYIPKYLVVSFGINIKSFGHLSNIINSIRNRNTTHQIKFKLSHLVEYHKKSGSRNSN